MPKNRTLKIVAGIAGSFTGLLGMIIFLLEMKIISVEMAILMLVALLGDVSRIRNSDCCLSLDWQAGMSALPTSLNATALG